MVSSVTAATIEGHCCDNMKVAGVTMWWNTRQTDTDGPISCSSQTLKRKKTRDKSRALFGTIFAVSLCDCPDEFCVGTRASQMCQCANHKRRASSWSQIHRVFQKVRSPHVASVEGSGPATTQTRPRT
jgi:hypothetical protein